MLSQYLPAHACGHGWRRFCVTGPGVAHAGAGSSPRASRPPQKAGRSACSCRAPLPRSGPAPGRASSPAGCSRRLHAVGRGGSTKVARRGVALPATGWPEAAAPGEQLNRGRTGAGRYDARWEVGGRYEGALGVQDVPGRLQASQAQAPTRGESRPRKAKQRVGAAARQPAVRSPGCRAGGRWSTHRAGTWCSSAQKDRGRTWCGPQHARMRERKAQEGR